MTTLWIGNTHENGSPRQRMLARDDGEKKAIDEAVKRLTFSEAYSLFLVLLGTFLECFDWVLYVHLAIVLNPLFFPTHDPMTAGLFSALTFSSAYLLRPLGSFVFGYVGDKKGRKTSIIWTSTLMGGAALTIACLPPYDTWGIIAPLLFILARATQGFSSIGEIVSAQVFTAEVTQKSSYMHFLSIGPTVTMILGTLCALGAGAPCLHLNPVSGWRWPFFLGGSVALVGGWIRLRAIESPAFQRVEQKKRTLSRADAIKLFELLEVRKRNYWCYFTLELLTPLTLYFTFRSCSEWLKHAGLSAESVIIHNFWVTVLNLLVVFLWDALTLKRDPLTILKRRFLGGLCVTPFLMGTLHTYPSEATIFMVQLVLLCLLGGGATPAQAQITQAFPVIGRCTNLGSAFAISHAGMYVVTSFGLVFLDATLGLWGIGVLFMMTTGVSLVCASQFRAEAEL